MQVFRVVSAALLAVVFAGGVSDAQPLSMVNGPKEFPPTGFRGNQYVDSTGCVFVRAGLGGQVTWVPRVDRSRKLVCGFQPSVPAAANVPATAPPDGQDMVQLEVRSPAARKPVMATASVKAATRSVRLVRVGSVTKAETYCIAPVRAARRFLLSDGRRVTRCRDRTTAEPVAYLNGLSVPGLMVEAGAPSEAETRRALKADQGNYRVVWSKGELSATALQVQREARPMPGNSASRGVSATRVAARYVQVGAFADPANAARAKARLQTLGLPVAVARERKGKLALQTILAGPFDNRADVGAALNSVRMAGFSDAFPRR